MTTARERLLTIARLALGAMLLSVLAACGGGDSTGGGAQPPNPVQVSINPASTTVPANPLSRLPSQTAPTTIQINVRVLTDTGTPVANGTEVALSTNNVNVGSLSRLDDPETDDVNEFVQQFGQVTAETSGGDAVFFFTSTEVTGTTTLNASVQDPNTNQTVTDSVTIEVTEAADQDRLTLDATATQLPPNTFGVGPFIGSPFISEVTIRFIDPEGGQINPANSTFDVAIAPVSTAAFSTLDDPETEDVNEFLVLLGNGPVDAAAGQATVFVHSGDQSGTATLTVTATDATTGENFTATLDIVVGPGAADGLPAQVQLSGANQAVFIQGAGGNTTAQLETQVLDAGDDPVDDPQGSGNAFNNVRLTLTPGDDGARLSGVNAEGDSVNGDQIEVATANGIATFGFTAGDEAGSKRIEATVDRADNNVDNGLQDPVTNGTTIQVGDGRLAGIEIVVPSTNAIQVNRVTENPAPDEMLETDPETGLVIPPDPDGTYSLTLSIIASDQNGAPVLPGTPIQFGKIDEPVTDPIAAEFIFSGVNGNPQEGGKLFTVPFDPPDGWLDNPGPDEVVQPGDTLVTFGDAVAGNDELESARNVDEILSDRRLNVQRDFNDNDAGGGGMVDDGAVIPYVIGRSQVGNIQSQATTGQDGTASVNLTYPINAIGRSVVVWAQGDRPEDGGTQTRADAESVFFPGIAPATLSIAPNTIPGNASATVTLCLDDALDAPIGGAPIGFSVDGSFSFQVLNAPLVTGTDGCVNANVNSSGLEVGEETQTVTFFAGDATTTLDIIPPDLAFLAAAPDPLQLFANNRTITVTAFDDSGERRDGIEIEAECSDEAVTVPDSAFTDQNGNATLPVSITGDEPPASDVCNFTANVGGSDVGASVLVIILDPDGIRLDVNPEDVDLTTNPKQVIATATFGSGAAIAGEDVKISGCTGEVDSTPSSVATTNANGEASFLLGDDPAGTANMATCVFDINVDGQTDMDVVEATLP